MFLAVATHSAYQVYYQRREVDGSALQDTLRFFKGTDRRRLIGSRSASVFQEGF
jgi:hypothetical protein